MKLVMKSLQQRIDGYSKLKESIRIMKNQKK